MHPYVHPNYLMYTCEGLFRDNPSISDVIFIVKEHYTQKSAKKKEKTS